MIKKISIHRLRNAELLQFNRQLLEIVSVHNPEELKISAQLQAHKNALSVTERAFKKENSSPLTEVLIDLDEKRDKLLIGISTCVDAFTNHFNEETRMAAQLLKDNLASFGTTIIRENYMRESALINKLVTDWRTKPEFSNCVAALNLNLWLKSLYDANEAFNTRYLERNKAMGSVNADVFKQKKQELIATYDKLIYRLNALNEIEDGAEPFTTVVQQINELIDKYHLLIIGRRRGEAVQPVSTSTN
ncbi:MAG: DUF6261 family protein [Cyclobacteriaceae bacterium]|jgi:hypothetical protein|nr:DUF6261 family protein [Flammeovirgaceae bacterium]